MLANQEQVRMLACHRLWHIGREGILAAELAMVELIRVNLTHQVGIMILECLQSIVDFQAQIVVLYLELVDRLISHPPCYFVLHSQLPEIYSTIIKILSDKDCWAQIEHAKVMRKFWMGRISPQLYISLKQSTFAKTRIDVDQLVNQANIEAIQSYFLNTLNIPPEIIHSYLPQTTIYKQNSSLKRTLIFIDQTHPVQKHFIDPQRKILSIPTDESDLFSQGQFNLKTPNYRAQKQEGVLLNEDSPKRRRLNPIGYQKEVKQYDEFKKLRKLDEETIYSHKSKQVRAALFGQTLECVECGLRFQNAQNLRQHRSDHVRERIRQFNAKQQSEILKGPVKTKDNTLTTIEKWTSSKLQPEEVDCYLPQWVKIKPYTCTFCCQKFTIRTRDDRWVIADAILVEEQDEKKSEYYPQQLKWMHYSCYTNLFIPDTDEQYE